MLRAGRLGVLSDRELLEQFEAGDEADGTFEILVAPHGPMARALCRSLLGDAHEADDGFQVTVLVLARRADSIRDKEALASWLYGVAYRVVTRMRSEATRRSTLSRHLTERARHAATTGLEASPEPMPELYEKLARLPERYRAPIVLCYLQGQSHEQAARARRCPLRTLQTRLLRVKENLRGDPTCPAIHPPAPAGASWGSLLPTDGNGQKVLPSTSRRISPSTDECGVAMHRQAREVAQTDRNGF